MSPDMCRYMIYIYMCIYMYVSVCVRVVLWNSVESNAAALPNEFELA